MGVIGWLAAAQAMIAFGSVQGVIGSLVAGWALYGIMSREWTGADWRRLVVTKHVFWTMAAAAGGVTAEAVMLVTGTGGPVPWEQLPMVTVLAGAMHNARHGPPIDRETYPSGPPKEQA